VGAAEGEDRATDSRRRIASWRAGFSSTSFFSSIVATKLPNYILPAVRAPCAILIARFLDRWANGSIRPPAWLSAIGLIALFLIGATLLWAWRWWAGS